MASHPDHSDALASPGGGILVVEDDYLVAMELEAALSEAGYNIMGIARTAEEAERLALQYRPMLIIMDINLASQRDGVDAAICIFKTCGIRSIFATAYRDPSIQLRASPALPLGWLAKPYTIDCLIAKIRESVARLENPQAGGNKSKPVA